MYKEQTAKQRMNKLREWCKHPDTFLHCCTHAWLKIVIELHDRLIKEMKRRIHRMINVLGTILVIEVIIYLTIKIVEGIINLPR